MNVDSVNNTDQGQGIPSSLVHAAGSDSMTASMKMTSTDVEEVTDVSSTSSSEAANMSQLDDELDALDGTDLGDFLLDTFVPDDVIGGDLHHHHSHDDEAERTTYVEAAETDMSDVATAAMLMVDMPELCV
jgi:hypothetical protein